jgi:hypothetical protein
VIKRFLFFLLFFSTGISADAQFHAKKIAICGPSYQTAFTVSGGYYHGNFSKLNNELSLMGIKPGFAIGIRGMYRYDVSNARWKSNPVIEPKLPGTKISGLGFQAFIGWGKNSF